jgi:two-component system sensor histidine kinase EvgS
MVLEEIEKVHLETLRQLRSDHRHTAVNEAQFQTMVHKVKGGAQLLQASQFIHACQELEGCGLLPERIERFIALLENQNETIATYKKKYR